MGVSIQERAQLEGRDGEPLGLEAAEYLTDQAPFDSVGLADDQGAMHGRQT